MKCLRRLFRKKPRRNPDGRFESVVDSVRRDMVHSETINQSLELYKSEILSKAEMVAEVAYVGD